MTSLARKLRSLSSGMGCLILLAAVLGPHVALAATREAATCNAADVGSAVGLAAAGDTVLVPAGACIWSQSVTISKPITVAGAGPTATVITGNDTTVFEIDMSVAGRVRLTGMGFLGRGGNTQLETAMINLRGVLDGVRLDHLRFENIPFHAVYIGLWDAVPVHPRVLFDHIEFVGGAAGEWQRFLKMMGHNDTWKLPDLYGSDSFVFIEDSTFSWSTSGNPNAGVTDTEHGARLVVRHNLIAGGGVQVHDTGSTQGAKGQRATEIYANTFSCAVAGCGDIPAIGIRGGGWLIHNNAFAPGFWVLGYPQIYRATVGAGFLGSSCDGTPVPVCDTPNYYHCDGGDHRACGYPGDYACNGNGSCVIAAASPTDCPAEHPFIPNLDRADGGAGASGYPCRHQTGWGQESPDGRTEEPAPVYWWNNTLGGAAHTFSYDEPPWFLADRDYCNHDPSTACGTKTGWSYAPYSYPHPLQNADSDQTPPAAPANLICQ